MLFDTVEFLSAESRLINPVIEVNDSATNTTEAAVTKQAFDTALALKANTTDVNSLLAFKANVTDVSSSLALKANTTDVNSSLALKANTTDVNSSLALKANTTDVTSQISTAKIYDIAAFSQGKPDASSPLIRLITPRAFSLPQNLTGSIAKASVAATTSSVFTFKKNGSNIGTMTFSAGNTTATFSFSSSVSMAVGDILEFVSPATQDSTLSDISVTIVAALI